MKIVVTCGSPWSNIQAIEALLQAGGVQPAKAAQRYSLETIQAWHDRVVTAYSDDTNALLCPAPITPSKPWEQMATEIFAVNADQVCWGWADTKSTWFLDFWLNYDPHFRFVLIYAAPHKDFVKFIDSDDTEYQVNEFIQTWLDYNNELLKFHNRHSDRCVLLNYETCLNSPEAFRKLCNEKFGLNFTEVVSEQFKSDDTLPLLELLALQILQSYQEVKELFAEMEATAFKTIPAKDGLQNVLLSEAINEYQKLRKLSQQLANEQQKSFQLVKEKVKLNDRLADMERERDQSNQAQQLLQQQLSEIQAQQQTVQKEIQQENELLLLQLHQAQEELEHHFVESQSLQSRSQDTTELLQGQIDQLNQEKNQLTAVKTDFEHRIATLEGELKQFNQTQHLLQKQLGEAQAQQQSAQKEIQQENELLLLQLHQVQEELEHYFLEYQALQSQNQETVSRWQRLYARLPDYQDYSVIDICDVEKRTDYSAIKWTIGDFFQGNRNIPSLTFKTVVDNGSMGLLFEKEDENNNPGSLLSWSLHINNQSDFFINLFAKQADESDVDSTQLSKLAATDWVMLKRLFNVLTNALEQENILPLTARSKIDIAYWLNVITVLRQAYLDMPDIFRFDEVFLYREYVDPHYEHLWFKFKEVRFGDSYWPDFQFRLSAADVKPESFSVFPKLEFPLSDDKTLPFQKWAIEIKDAFGERMELRFALAPPAIDIQTWNSFVAHDQSLVASILQQVPFILELVERQGSRISRPYDDWKKIANDMQSVFKHLITQA